MFQRSTINNRGYGFESVSQTFYQRIQTLVNGISKMMETENTRPINIRHELHKRNFSPVRACM